jgi:hypothetical protein
MRLLIRFLSATMFLLMTDGVAAQNENMDESKVNPYTLPDLLSSNGKKISNVKQWERSRKPEILSLYQQHVYGRIPGRPSAMHFITTSIDRNALQGKATRKEVTIYFTAGEQGPSMHLLLWIPNKSDKSPVFVGLNFDGNHTTHTDSSITVTEKWKTTSKNKAIVRGSQSTRWQVDTLIAHGYGLATAWYQDVERDDSTGWQTGIRTTLQESLQITPKEWGALAVWGWANSRIMDYLETDEQVDAKRVILTGHSRLGKAALWGAANDKRFAAIISNNSGEGGAALARRNFGEDVKRINRSFPHWFIGKFKDYSFAVDQLPVDQHMLLATMAPRPLYVASALEDAWADPKGEFLSAWHASAAYALYVKKGIPSSNMPPVNSPAGKWVRYHIRTGKHDVTLFDWQQYIDFADEYVK